MIKVELFGKSCIFGLVGHRFRFHCVTAERIKTFKDLEFRVHPSDVRKRMARADFKNGYSVEVVPVADSVYYNVTILKDGMRDGENYLTASYCSADTVSGILEYYQRRRGNE